MLYTVHGDISYCETHDGVMFLDVGSDRYFRLPPALEKSFLAATRGQDVSARHVTTLTRLNILTEAPLATKRSIPAVPPPTYSALESPPAVRGTRAVDLAAVFICVARMSAALKTRSLKKVLESVESFRSVHAPPATKGTSVQRKKLLAASATFRQARRFTPIEPVCLLDSLAMVRYLAGRGLYANVVFGVTAAPFSAHCWVQMDDAVLNDTVGHSTEFTPIRVL